MGHKIKATRASARDKNKFTVATSELNLTDDLAGCPIVLELKGEGRKTHKVYMEPSRKGTTYYGDCPRTLKVPAVGKPTYYTLVDVGLVLYV